MPSQESIRARRYFILESAARSGGLSFSQIRELLKPKVSDPTLRKDINDIADLLVVFKDSRGGLAVRSKGLFGNTYFGANLQVNAARKERIAQCLVEDDPRFECFPLINRSGDSCVVGPGTTTLAVLCVLAKYPCVEVLTTNLGVLDIPDLLTKPSFHLSGGWCLSPVASLVGTAAVRSIDAFGGNSSIIGISGLAMLGDDSEIQLYCHHEAQLPVKQALVRGRKNIIVVTCGSKLERKDVWEFVTVSQLLKESNFYIVADRVSDHISRKLRNCLDKLSSRSNNDYVAKLIELEKHESTE